MANTIASFASSPTCQNAIPLARLSVLVLGEIQRREFGDVATSLAAETTHVVRAADLHKIDSSHSHSASWDADSTDLIVLCQSFPGEFSPSVVDRLRAAMPLAPLVAVLGAWCAGEERTGTARTGTAPLRGLPRIAATEWNGWGVAECDRIRRRVRSLATLPATSGDDERFLADTLPPLERPISVAIHHDARLGVDPAMTTMLTCFFETQRFVIVPEVTRADWVVLDVAAPPASTLHTAITSLRATLDETSTSTPTTAPRIAVLLHSPRDDEVAALRDLGVAAVVAKPFNLFTLQRLLS